MKPHITEQSLEEACQSACELVGVVYKPVPNDGRHHAADLDGPKNGKGDGRIKLFADGEGGIVYNWQTGVSLPFFVGGDHATLNDAERKERNRKRAESVRKAEEETRQLHAAAATKAKGIYDLANGDPTKHPYQVTKQVPFGPLVRRGQWSQRGGIGSLIVPMFGKTGEIQNIQAIFPEVHPVLGRDKDFLYGGKKAGCFHPLGDIQGADKVYIGEGLATVAAVHSATGLPCAAAMDAGNLEAVALAVRKLAPDAEIILLADNDIKKNSPTNTGVEYANNAALAVGGFVAIPHLNGKKCDFLDILNESGPEVVRSALDAATEPPADEPHPNDTHQYQEGIPDPDESILPHEKRPTDDPGGRVDSPLNKQHNQSKPNTLDSVELINGASIVPQQIQWIWPGWLASGKFHIMAGPPGTGKTTVCMAFGATLTGAGRWPDGTRAEVGNVLVWSGEDDPKDTLVPRLIAMGADMGKVFFVGDTTSNGETRPFDPSVDMERLTRAAAKIGDVKLLIVDPVVSGIAGDSHKNAEVRRGLAPLVDLGTLLRCAVIGITHFSKSTAGRDPVERVTGSIAFGALARVVMGAAKLPEADGGGRLLVRAKSNIGPDGGGFKYDLSQVELANYPGISASCVLWGNSVDGEARELLGQAEQSPQSNDEKSEIDDAKEFLESLLADSPIASKVVRLDSDGAGHSWATIRRASKIIGVESYKEGFTKGAWYWRLPPKVLKENRSCSQNIVNTFDNFERLRGQVDQQSGQVQPDFEEF